MDAVPSFGVSMISEVTSNPQLTLITVTITRMHVLPNVIYKTFLPFYPCVLKWLYAEEWTLSQSIFTK